MGSLVWDKISKSSSSDRKKNLGNADLFVSRYSLSPFCTFGKKKFVNDLLGFSGIVIGSFPTICNFPHKKKERERKDNTREVPVPRVCYIPLSCPKDGHLNTVI